jgi:hypothetical protein
VVSSADGASKLRAIIWGRVTKSEHNSLVRTLRGLSAMSRIRQTIFGVFMATVIAALGAPAAPADGIATSPDEVVANEVVATNEVADAAKDNRGAIAAPEGPVVPIAAPPKRKPVRAAHAPMARAATAPRNHCGCSGFWCGQQFVLMLGVGY